MVRSTVGFCCKGIAALCQYNKQGRYAWVVALLPFVARMLLDVHRWLHYRLLLGQYY